MGALLMVASSDILSQEFGVYNDPMPVPPAAMTIRKRNIYQRHKSVGQLPPLSQRNISGPIRAENSQFKRQSLPFGSTLGSRDSASYPKAPSRFSRP